MELDRTEMELDKTIGGMIGKTTVRVSDVKQGDEVVLFVMADDSVYIFYHRQACCEDVAVEDVCGDMTDLIGLPLLQAEEVTSEDRTPTDPFTGAACGAEGTVNRPWDAGQTWTFYKFATNKGGVTIRWLGQSNGCYSESVDLEVFRTAMLC